MTNLTVPPSYSSGYFSDLPTPFLGCEVFFLLSSADLFSIRRTRLSNGFIWTPRGDNFVPDETIFRSSSDSEKVREY